MDRAEAIARAMAASIERGWAWQEPVLARRRRAFLIGAHRWEVLSAADRRGMNVKVVIDDISGRIETASFFPR